LITGTAASFTPVTASGGTGTLSYALTGGSLPTGLNFSTATGLNSGSCDDKLHGDSHRPDHAGADLVQNF
jgi:hypothetical protein